MEIVEPFLCRRIVRENPVNLGGDLKPGTSRPRSRAAPPRSRAAPANLIEVDSMVIFSRPGVTIRPPRTYLRINRHNYPERAVMKLRTKSSLLAIVTLVASLLAVAAPAAAQATPTCDGKAATIVGTNGNDQIQGTSGNDVIVGLGGRDRIFGGAGNDIICGGDRGDLLRGQRGRDRLFGRSGQ
jgi:Ca2+-binding RTX toxin-like protein